MLTPEETICFLSRRIRNVRYGNLDKMFTAVEALISLNSNKKLFRMNCNNIKRKKSMIKDIVRYRFVVKIKIC
jgi:hypothetical protein